MSTERSNATVVLALVAVVAAAGAIYTFTTHGGGGKPGVPASWVPNGHHRASPLSAEATQRAEQRCLDQAKAWLPQEIREAVDSLAITDRYGVGDPESGAGDSLIVEGRGRLASGGVTEFRCSMADLGPYAGGPYLTHVEHAP